MNCPIAISELYIAGQVPWSALPCNVNFTTTLFYLYCVHVQLSKRLYHAGDARKLVFF